MSIELLAKQGRTRIYGGLAAVETSRLRQMRDNAMRSCFSRIEETACRMEHVVSDKSFAAIKQYFHYNEA